MANELTCIVCNSSKVPYKTKQLCRQCYSKERNRQCYIKYKEKILACVAKYRKAHPGYSNESKKKYRESHRIECNARTASWGQIHKLERANTEARRRARKMQNGVEKFDFQDIINRDKGLCGICGKKVQKGELCFDHIIPIVHGGAHISSNVQVAHKLCNARKGQGRLPSQIRLVLGV